MNNCGIYQIQCVVSGKLYIGSSKSIRMRWSHHRSKLRVGSHPSPRLQQAWNKHGERNFVFSVLEECDQEMLFVREQWHIDCFKPDYNSMLKVRVISKEMRGKMNAAMAAIAVARTHCPHGHEYTEKNSYLSKKNGARICRECNRVRVSKIYEAESEEKKASRIQRCQKYYQANRERLRAIQNEYSARNRDSKRAYDVAYRPIKNARRRERAIAQ
jgi:group I intron endonuclease